MLKQVLYFILIVIFISGINSCNRYGTRGKSGYTATKSSVVIKSKRQQKKENRNLAKLEKRKNLDSEKAKKDALKAQERGKQRHINKQTPEVQKRMKKSLAESERTRRKKNFWDRIFFWRE